MLASSNNETQNESSKQWLKKVSKIEYDEINDVLITKENIGYTELQEMDWQKAGLIIEIKQIIDRSQNKSKK